MGSSWGNEKEAGHKLSDSKPTMVEIGSDRIWKEDNKKWYWNGNETGMQNESEHEALTTTARVSKENNF